VSWNVNGIRAVYKKGFLNFWQAQNPDVLCVQETKAMCEQLTDDIIRPFGFESYWSAAEKKGYSGVATFHKTKLDGVVHGIGIDKFDKEGRTVVTQHDQFTLFNIYFPNGARGPERHDYKMDFLKSLYNHLKPRVDAGEPIIVVGDYNIAPTNIDIYDPIKHSKTSGFLPEERDWYQSFLQMGFVDTFRHFHPTECERYSWWNQMERARLGNRGWRIDMICVTKNLVRHMKNADILDEVEGSDHCPVTLEIF